MSKIFSSEKSTRSDFGAHVTPWLSIRVATQQKAYEIFKINQSNIYVFFVLQIIFTIYFIITGLSTITYSPSFLTTIMCGVSLVFPVFLGWVLFVVRMVKHCARENRDETYLCGIVSLLESIWLLGVCASMCLQMGVVAYNGHCPPGYPAYQGLSCNYSSTHQMQEDLEIIVLVLPFFLTMIVKGAKWAYIVLAFVGCFCSLLFIMLHFDLTVSLTSFLMFTPFCILVLYENQRQSLALFLSAQNQEDLLVEVERLAEETRSSELRQMIGNVAHDLKTPLSAYVSGIDYILATIFDAQNSVATNTISGLRRILGTVQETVADMKNTNEFMLMTINRCVDYTKAINGVKLAPRLETINLREALAMPLKCMSSLLTDHIQIKMLPFTHTMATNIITDKLWLQENILCMLSNAVRFSTGGLVTLSVSLVDRDVLWVRQSNVKQAVIPEVEAEMILIEVEDCGIGISDEIVGALFGQFKQAQSMVGGTGLGLYSLARRVESLGGKYGVDNRRDGKQGSLFWFTIPYRPDTSELCLDDFAVTSIKEETSDDVEVMDDLPPTFDVQEKLATENRVGRNGSIVDLKKLATTAAPDVVPKMSILLVDDSLSIQKMTCMLLRKQGHTVVTADNGAMALEMMSDLLRDSPLPGAGRFDVVLMDLLMPVMDGLEATSRIRKLERNFSVKLDKTGDRDTPRPRQLIIGVSANSDNETMNAAFEAGIDAFIPKPFTMQSFKETYLKCVKNYST